MISVTRWFKLIKLKLLREKGSGYFVAMGAVVGLMVGMIIPMGGQTLIALFLAWILRVSKTAACTFTFISNPWSVIFIYPFQIWFGGLISGITISQATIDDFIEAGNKIKIMSLDFSAMGTFLADEGSGIMINFVIGGTILGTIISLLSYPTLIKFLNRHHIQRSKRIILRAEIRARKLKQMIETELAVKSKKSPEVSDDLDQS
ncbi:MAG: DUF2062 domain-containing protein [Lentisphaeria bacterium]|nr:DUF2062 domain-containing protein [Lentisphaeria bacterium]